MTWVVGANTAFGYGLIVSDTCVTFPDGRELDLVQKSYPIAPDMIAGFSGNVKNGFIHLGLMQRFLQVPEADMARDPIAVAEQFPKKARYTAESFPGYVANAPTSILLVGIHPDKRNAFGYPMSVGAVFRSPDFEPTMYYELNDLFSIGSGNDVEKYMSTLRDVQKDWVKFSNMGSGGYGTVVKSIIAQTVFKNRAEGISAHTHTLYVTQGQYDVTDSSHQEFLGTGEVVAVHQMPKVATSWGELVSKIGDLGIASVAIG